MGYEYIIVESKSDNAVVACCETEDANHEVLKGVLQAMYPDCKVFENHSPLFVGHPDRDDDLPF